MLSWLVSALLAALLCDGGSNVGSVVAAYQLPASVSEARIDVLSSRLEALDYRVNALVAQVSSLRDDQDSRHNEPERQLHDHEAKLAEMAAQLERLKPCNPRDCSDLPPGSPSGIYQLQLGPDSTDSVSTYCDLDTDGGRWTVIQRRADIEPREDFYLGWEAYKAGFGELDGEFWWGLENMSTMTSVTDREYELRIDLEDFDGEKRYAVYQGFKISSEEDGYRLLGSDYSGNAGDSLALHFGQRFTTKDKDQDTNADKNCATNYDAMGAWWYNNCWHANLNGIYRAGVTQSWTRGVAWLTWRGFDYSLKGVEMKIRPTSKCAKA